MSSSAGWARSGRVGGIRAAGLAAFVGLTAAGCATLPSSGPITKVEEGDEGASQVQIWPSSPNPGAIPSAIVSGFLEAAQSGAANQRIAADYLTPAMQKAWQSEQNTVIVLADYSQGLPQSPSSGAQQGANAENVPPYYGGSATSASGSSGLGSTVTEQVLGTVIGRLDAQGMYSAESAQGDFVFTVTKIAAGYRISSLPHDFGVLMERSDFESSYSRHVVYYGNPLQAGAFVPADIYLPAVESDDEVARQMAQLIVSGVPKRLSPTLKQARFVGLELDGGGGATVTVKAGGACTQSLGPCDELAQQLAQSLGALSLKVGTVAVTDESSNQSTAQYPPLTGMAGYGLDEPGSANQNRVFYAVSAGGALESLTTLGTVSDSDMSLSGAGKLRFKQVAVAPGSIESGGAVPEHTALLGSDGYSVYVAHRQGDAETLTDVFPGSVAPRGGTVGSLSWDWDTGPGGGGALWFTYTLDHVTSLYRYFDGALSQVTVTGLAGATIAGVAPAPDGDRVAVGYVDADGDYSIAIGAITQSGGGFSVDLGEDDAEVVAAAWSSVTGFDWYDEDSLAVLGLPASAQELGLYQLYADGSPVYDTLTLQPVQASPPSQADGFVWNAAGPPIAAAVSGDKDMLYTLSVEGQDAQPLSGASGTSPSY